MTENDYNLAIIIAFLTGVLLTVILIVLSGTLTARALFRAWNHEDTPFINEKSVPIADESDASEDGDDGDGGIQTG